MKTIEVGDYVEFCFAKRVCLANQNEVLFRAFLLHIPQDVGDCYHAQTKQGIVFTVNPSNSFFVGITLIAKESEL